MDQPNGLDKEAGKSSARKTEIASKLVENIRARRTLCQIRRTLYLRIFGIEQENMVLRKKKNLKEDTRTGKRKDERWVKM